MRLIPSLALNASACVLALLAARSGEEQLVAGAVPYQITNNSAGARNDIHLEWQQAANASPFPPAPFTGYSNPAPPAAATPIRHRQRQRGI